MRAVETDGDGERGQDNSSAHTLTLFMHATSDVCNADPASCHDTQSSWLALDFVVAIRVSLTKRPRREK